METKHLFTRTRLCSRRLNSKTGGLLFSEAEIGEFNIAQEIGVSEWDIKSFKRANIIRYHKKWGDLFKAVYMIEGNAIIGTPHGIANKTQSDVITLRYPLKSYSDLILELDEYSSEIFNAWEGGGEYNVARGLRRCWHANSYSNLFAEQVGRLIEDFILQEALTPKFVQWKDFDGIERETRNGVNFTERGFGIRGAKGTSDRGHTAASQTR